MRKENSEFGIRNSELENVDRPQERPPTPAWPVGALSRARFILVSLFLCLIFSASFAQTAIQPGEVGVDEKLGQQIPMDLVLKDEEGNDVRLGALVDRPTILTLNYFRCAGICTPLLNGVVEMLNAVQLEPDKAFRVITVSFDDRDTPDIAQRKKVNYLKQMKRPFPPTGWRFLTGDAASTKKLTDAVGFKFKKSGEDFIHAGVIVVISPTGKVTRYMYGVSFLPADVQMALGEALREQPQPTVSRFLQFCYSYDPEGRRYVFSVTKAAAALVLLAAAVFVAYLVVKGRRKPAGEKGASQ